MNPAHRSSVMLFAGLIVYMWTSDSGTISFTNDPKRIPERYAEQATAHELTPFEDYFRFTPLAEPAVWRAPGEKADDS